MKDCKTIKVFPSRDYGVKGSVPSFFERCIELFGFDSMRDAYQANGFLKEPDPKEVRTTLRSFGFPLSAAMRRIQIECAVDDEFELQVRDVLFCFLETWEQKIAKKGGNILSSEAREQIAYKCGELALKLFLKELKGAFRINMADKKKHKEATLVIANQKRLAPKTGA